MPVRDSTLFEGQLQVIASDTVGAAAAADQNIMVVHGSVAL